MRRVLIIVAALPLAVSPAAIAAEHASLWVGTSGLQARLSQDGNEYVLRAEHAGLLGDWFSGISTGTILLRARRTGDELTGTAYVFSPGCTFSYQVVGRWKQSGTALEWWGEEPKDKAPDSCRVTATALVTTSLRLKWAPPAPTLPRIVAQSSAVQRPPSAAPSSGAPFLIGLAIIIVGAVAALFARLAYLHRLRANKLTVRPLPPAPREPASAFSSSLPSSSGKILGSRTQIVQSDAEFVRQHTQWLMQRTAQSNAAADLVQSRLRLVDTLSQLATVPALMNQGDPNASPSSFSLSLAEIEQMIAAMPEISQELRGALLRLLAARLKEKLQ